ncbi:MAG: sugar O-acetyltransferase [Oscillospiraceae bacterium]
MTELEKMLRGELYDPSDRELSQMRVFARKSEYLFNRTEIEEYDSREAILKAAVGFFGEDSYIEPPLRFDYASNTYIGSDCYINSGCTFLDCAKIEIGDNAMLGPNVSLFTPLHPLVASERAVHVRANGEKYQLEYALPIKIGSGCWLGGNTVVNAGVTIGDNSVIGSGSVVTRDIPPNVIAAGVPCRVLREIGDDDRMLGRDAFL